MRRRFEKRFFRSDSGKNLKSKTCPELSRRSENLKWVGLSLIAYVLVVTAAVATAQQPLKIPLIGRLSPGSSANTGRTEAFRQGLRELGYVEGKNIVIERRSAEGGLDRLPALAAELRVSRSTSSSRLVRQQPAPPRRNFYDSHCHDQ